MAYNQMALDFIMAADWSELPEAVQHQAKRCLMDTLGALIAGHRTPVAELLYDFVAEHFKGETATILVRGGKSMGKMGIG